jgi:hypothetical protein
MLDEETINQLAELVANPHAGQAFSFNGEHFTRRFLKIDQQAELTAITLEVMKNAKPDTQLGTALMGSFPELKRALAVILTDQKPECNTAFIDEARGKDASLSVMVNIVVGQMILNDMGDLLGKVLAIAAIAGSLMPKR